jgi:DNA-directed RNA polymerase subunit beta'
LIRGNILGKRVDFSGRSVIAPDPTLSLEYCRLPYKLLLEIYKLQIANKLVERNKFKIINKAINYVDYCFDSGDDSLLSLVEEIIDGEVCILNRQPSLHRTSMLGFKILVTMSNSIKIHPLVCPPFNADFDGDQMAVYIPISQETKQEILDKVLVTKNLINASNWSLSVTPSQDIILGIYMLSINSIDSLKEIVECKGSMIPKSMKMINDCFPEDYPLVNMQLTKRY